jgi:hypothetical protein
LLLASQALACRNAAAHARETENRRASSEIEIRTGFAGGMVSSASPAMTRLDRIISPALRSANGPSSGVNCSGRTPVRYASQAPDRHEGRPMKRTASASAAA